MILKELVENISERMSEVRGGTRRSRLLVGVALCVALFALVGCPDAPDTAPPVITLTGDAIIEVNIGSAFTDPGFAVNDNDPNYTGTVTPTIRDSGGTEVSANTFTATAGTYAITYTAPADAADNAPVAVTRMVTVINSIDRDTNNRIDINFLEDLDAVRNNLAGTMARCGSDGTTACEGYELLRDLNFADGDSYADGTVNTDWRPDATDPDSATNSGWEPIGAGIMVGGADSFSGMFFGNGFVIANLYVRRDNDNVGLFGANTGTIQRIGVVDGSVYGGAGSNNAGGLVGLNSNSGTITTSYATGDVNGGEGGDGNVGGLVGLNNTGIITASYATGDVDGGAGSNDNVGGLVGLNNTGIITASYATGSVNGGAGASDRVGGLVGLNNFGATVTASYATGDVDGENVNGLIGIKAGTNTASYGFGTATGGTVATPRSTDASPSGTVADACAITEANSSATGTDWDAAQWDFGTATQRPIVLHDGVAVRGQTDRRC